MPKSKNSVTKSGPKKEGTARSAVTGRQMGRGAVRAMNKNANVAENFMDSVEDATSRVELQALVLTLMAQLATT